MNLFKSVAIAFSMYSKIPMPNFRWDEENYKHGIAFLPLVGMVIGGLSLLAAKALDLLELPAAVIAISTALVPLVLTGGFHLDGFMDVKDALSSYQDREKKLEIMKDPHIGAFAVIGAGVQLLIWLGAAYVLVYRAFDSDMTGILWGFYGSFPLVRAVCGIISIVFPRAKKDGMLAMETGKSGVVDICILTIFGILSLVYMFRMNFFGGICAVASLAVYTPFYKHNCDRNFGGVTGDTAGYFVVTAETVILVVLAVFSTLWV